MDSPSNLELVNHSNRLYGLNETRNVPEQGPSRRCRRADVAC